MTSKILIVEDDGIFAIGLQNKLKQWDYDVPKIALSANEALNMVQDNIDLVIMDIHLKGEMDGISAGQTIENKYKIPIVFYSAHQDQLILDKIKEFENCDFVNKTSSDEDLKLSIENILKIGESGENTEVISQKDVKTADVEEVLGDYYKSHEKIENEFKTLETSFSKIYEESLSKEIKIEEFQKTEENYIKSIQEKDKKLTEMRNVQLDLEEKIENYNIKHNKLLREMNDLKKHMNSITSILDE